LLFTLSLPTLFAFLRLADLILTLRFVASLLFPALLAFQTFALLLLSPLLPALLPFLAIALLLLAALFPTLLLLRLLLASLLLGLCRLAGFSAALSLLLALLLTLLALGLIFLPPLLTAATPALRIREVACAKQKGGCR
jgi:hypothetical protein